MSSKITVHKNVDTPEVKPFSSPSVDELELMIAGKRRDSLRQKILYDNKNDPVQAARREANRIMIEAQDKLKEAEAEAVLFKTQKENEIRARLEKEFQEKLELNLTQIQSNYRASLEELTKIKQIMYDRSEKQLMELVIAISRKIIDNEIKVSPDLTLNMLRKCFDRIKDAKEYEILINPVDYEILLKRKNEIDEIVKTPGTVKFTKDEHIERGGCRIITELGEISSEPGKQLDIILRELSYGD